MHKIFQLWARNFKLYILHIIHHYSNIFNINLCRELILLFIKINKTYFVALISSHFVLAAPTRENHRLLSFDHNHHVQLTLLSEFRDFCTSGHLSWKGNEEGVVVVERKIFLQFLLQEYREALQPYPTNLFLFQFVRFRLCSWHLFLIGFTRPLDPHHLQLPMMH